MKKLLLINPSSGNGSFTFNEPLSLGIIAALTPLNYKIELIDENFEQFIAKDCDLAAITATTASSNRAYQIAGILKSKNIPTIIGGIHASLNPEEASNYFTTVVIGDAEPVWEKVIKDFESNSLKKTYISTFEKRQIKEPNREIFRKYNYPAHTVETTRGCIFDCDFCSVSAFHNKTYYERPIEELLIELKKLKKKLIFFSDDNFIGRIHNKQRLIEILNQINPLKIKWYSFSSINIYYHQDILQYMKQSGCVMLHIGFESDEQKSLKEVNKNQNIQFFNKNKLNDIVSLLHSYKITVMGGFIYGFDSDDLNIMNKRLERIFKSQIDWFTINILTPLPGSKMFNNMLKANRIMFKNYPKDWSNYNFGNAVFKPQNMSIEVLNTFFHNSSKIYNNKHIRKRFFKTLLKTRSFTSTYYLYLWIINHWPNVRNNTTIMLYVKFFNIFNKK